MRLVSGAKYADLLYRYQRVTEAREQAEKLAAERLSTITRQAEEITRLRDHTPDTPLPQPRPVQGDTELRRQLHLARRALASLDQQCRTLQSSNEAQVQELRDLREGSTS
ncbi:hypothetical protein [Streptomyces sp. NPDC090798]|uniref:hypothetical protein n=1 Tax=Streptomyces sp. NPDC090798 TaxID=3365968 RepID=UPI003813E62B